MPISYSQLEEVAYALNRRAAIAVPLDARKAFEHAAARETNPDAKRALLAVIDNAGTAVTQQSSMCGDTGLPRFYVKAGNDLRIEGGFIVLERALRTATARATKDVPLRSNRVHPLTRRNPVPMSEPELVAQIEGIMTDQHVRNPNWTPTEKPWDRKKKKGKRVPAV